MTRITIMKNLYNPTDNKIEVQINGKVYSVEPKSTVSLPEADAEYWVTHIHHFMSYVGSAQPKEEVVEETKSEEVPAEEPKKESAVKKVVKKLKK